MSNRRDQLPTALCQPQPPARGDAGAALPIVIRPRPLELQRLEQLLRSDGALARRLLQQPLHLHSMARALLRRDRQARLRFADAEALVAHLQRLL